MAQVKFTQMKDGDAADYALLMAHEVDYASKTGDRLLKTLANLDGSLEGYQITRLGHSLQSATRAWRDGADVDWIISALLHDIGDELAPYNHDEYAAAILRPYVREQCAWVVQVHADFQKLYYADKIGGNPNARDRHAGHPYFDDCAAFCALWDQTSFDPAYDTLPLDFFAPMVQEVFQRPVNDPAHIRPGVRIALTDAERAADRSA